MLKNEWQKKSLQKLEEIFKNDAEIMILVGSLADENILVDEWSDIDLKITLDKKLIKKYYFDLKWLEKLWNIFSVEKNHSENFYTIRVCLDNFERFDITFITNWISEIENWHIIWKYKIIFSNTKNLPEKIDKIEHKKWWWINLENLQSFQGNYWHKANNAIIKVMRNDLIIAHHLTLDLARDCLVLQMNLRDKKLNTNIHRTWDFWNKIIQKLMINEDNYSERYILNSIKKYSKLFEELSIELWLKSEKYSILKEFIELTEVKK